MSDRGGDPPCWSHLLDRDGEERSGFLTAGVVVDLGEVTAQGNGAVWSLPHGGDLDANLIRLEPEGSVGAHVNDDLDVLVVVQSGAGVLLIGEDRVELPPGRLILIPRGVMRAFAAGPAGITYLSVHLRRGPLGIGTARKDRS